MIKVNLLKSQSGRGSEDFGATHVNIGGGAVGKAEQIQLVKNIIIVLIPTFVLIAYEWYNVDILTKQRDNIGLKLKSTEQKLSKVTSEMKLYADVEQEAKILEDKISILRDLSRIRLREVKALDFLQSVTPEAVWFSSVVYKDLKFVFRGFAITDDALTLFMRELSNSAYFENAILMKATEEKKAEGTVKVFEIQADSGGAG